MPPHRALLLLLWVLFVSTSRVPLARAQVHAPTNFELVRDAARRAAEDLVTRLEGAGAPDTLALRHVGSHEGGFLVESTLSAVLAGSGHPVRTRPDSLGQVLEFEVVDLGLAYTRVWRHAWLGDKKVEREARARVFARLVDEARASILWADQAEAKVADEVRHEDLGELEERSGPAYLQATLPAQSWNKFVEPVVVTGIVVGLIVLFFSNQDVSN